MDNTDCPISGDQHRYFIFKSYEEFIPVAESASKDSDALYQKVEKAVLGCNCGSVIKTKVKVQ